jgi:hypothetical protein
VASRHSSLQPDAAAVAGLRKLLNAAAKVCNRVVIGNAMVQDAAGATIVSHFYLTAALEHPRLSASPWLINYDGDWQYGLPGGFRLFGTARIGTEKEAAAGILARGELSFRGLNLANLEGIQGFAISAQTQGDLRVILHEDGTISGHANADAVHAVIGGAALTTHPLDLGHFSLTTAYEASGQSFSLTKVIVTQGQEPVLTGSFALANPCDPARTAALKIGGVRIALIQLASWLQTIRAVPPRVTDAVRHVTSGYLEIEQMVLSPRQPLKNWNAAIVRDSLQIGAILSDGGFGLKNAASPSLPPVSGFEAGLAYNKGVFQITQGSGAFGQSSLTGINAQVRLNDPLRSIPYSFRFKATADCGELYALADPLIRRPQSQPSLRIDNVQGAAAVRVQASGTIARLTWTPPRDYTVALAPNHIEFAVKNVKPHLALLDGNIILRPGLLQIDHLLAAPVTPDGGDVLISGTIDPDPQAPHLRDLTLELHQLKAEQWIPLIVEPKQLAITGELGGKLDARPDWAGTPVITGQVTLAHGSVQLGFVRSPMIASSGTLTLDGRGLRFNLPGAMLEGHPIDFTVTLTDFHHPSLRIDVNASYMDLEVLRFIRLPWSPKTPVTFFPLPANGHIEARRANFDKLQMTDVSTDFSRANGYWSVTGFKADTLGGKVAFDLFGRSADQWINARGSANGINTGSIFTMISDPSPPLSGTLHADFDLWGNTDVNFFQSLAGKLSLQMTHGVINRLTLLTRILSLIDLKTWLTAHLPDPRVAGVPYDSVTADFTGRGGNMHTSNFRLNGPLLMVTAKGNLNLGDTTIDMELSVIPFQTYSWLLTKIPLVGTHIAGGAHDLLAAYFHVYGPIADPKVHPKPITSVAAFVAKTLSLPVNIIKPNTINP